MTTLETYGWNAERATQWSELNDTSTRTPARIVADYGSHYTVATPEIMQAQLSGASAHRLQSTNMPKIGDWVAVELTDAHTAIIHTVLSRTSEIVRGHVGRQLDKQVIATNVDTAFVMQPLDHDFSPERLQRYVFQLTSQSVEVVILLNKADQSKTIEDKYNQLESLGVERITMSALHDTDLSALNRFITPGKTVVILGSSGAGKSTLTNRLLGEQRQATQEIRERDSKGRHTTVHRELFVLPSGGIIIDTPGIRELQLWGSESDLEATFSDVLDVVRQCHYSNCSHDTEDRCAVKARLADGTLDKKRYATYLNFKNELQALDKRRGFIADRRAQQTKEAAKRHHKRSQRMSDESERIDIDE